MLYPCLRILFGLLNGLLWVLGCGVVGVAIWLRVSYQGYMSLFPQHELLSLDALVLMGGVLLFVVAFLGCCGAWCKNRCLLISYFVLVVVLFIAELTCGVLGFVYSEPVASTLQNELLTGIRYHYNTSSENGITLAWDHLQYQLSCCGVTQYDDWFNITAWPEESSVPHSCCISSFQHIAECGKLGEISMWFPTGCYHQIQKWFEERLHFVGIAGFVVAFLQFFGLTSSMIIFCAVRHRAGVKTYKAQKSPGLL